MQEIDYYLIIIKNHYSVQLPLWYCQERNAQWVTLCGSVARHVAEFLGRRIPQGENPRLLQDYYKKNYWYIWECRIENIPKNAYLLDIFLSSNTESGKKWGHRVLTEKVDENWYVYDPFFETNSCLLLEYIAIYRTKRGNIQKVHAYF